MAAASARVRCPPASPASEPEPGSAEEAAAEMTTRYVGRFAPSPTGLLHAGSLVAALASWLDARANGGRWLVRIEDLDTPRNLEGAAEGILDQLARCGLVADEVPWRQSTRTAAYEQALDRLVAARRAFACACSRRDLELAAAPAHGERTRHAERIYPGTCRDGLQGRTARSFRLRVDATGPRDSTDGAPIEWLDRRLGAQRQNVAGEVGDFVLKRADGVWAYQLAVVVDDAAQEVSDVVRGEDLAGNTARQILLQRLLGLPTPRYLHTPLVLAANGEKLSKQTGARPLDLSQPLATLRSAGWVLGIEARGGSASEWLGDAIAQWRGRWPLPPTGPVTT
jgi:glutamyl-Q tRNA(Asp) synthetase